jgi:hypothetical protein
MGNIKEKPKVLHFCFFSKFGKLYFKYLQGIENCHLPFTNYNCLNLGCGKMGWALAMGVKSIDFLLRIELYFINYIFLLFLNSGQILPLVEEYPRWQSINISNRIWEVVLQPYCHSHLQRSILTKLCLII